MIPPDVAAALSNGTGSSSTSSSSSSPAGSSPTPQAGSQTNGANFLVASPRALVGLAALVPMLFAL